MADTTINGRKYQTAAMPAKEAIALYTDVLRVAGSGVNKLPAVLMAVTAPDDRKNDLADIAALSAVAEILRNTHTDTAVNLIERIIGLAEVAGDSGNYRTVTWDEFQGDLKSLFPLVKWVMTEQFGDFFTGSGANGIISMIREAFNPPKSGK